MISQELKKKTTYQIRNTVLLLTGAAPYIKACFSGPNILSWLSLASISLICSIIFFLKSERKEEACSAAVAAFMILTAGFLILTGKANSGLVWILFISPINKTIASRNDSLSTQITLLAVIYIIASLISRLYTEASPHFSFLALEYIFEPGLLIASLWAANSCHDKWEMNESTFKLPSFFIAPLMPNKKNSDEEHLLKFLNSFEEGIFIANREGTIINTSRQFASFFETTPEELTGFSVFDKYALPQSHQIKAFNLIKKNMDGLPSGPDEFVFEVKGGKKLRLLIMTMPIIIDSSPSLIGIAKPLQRQKIKSNPNKTKDKFQALSENSTDIIIRFDKQLRHIYANYAITGLTGMAVENFLGKTCHETGYPKSILETLEEKVAKVFETGEPIETEFFHDWGTGEVYFDLRLIPEKSRSGKVETVLSTARDITALKKAHKTIQTLTQEIIKAQELERNKIALDLHDNVAQNLASLKIACDTILDQEPNISEKTSIRFRQFSIMLKTGIDSIRELAYNLRPPGLDQLGIIKTLSQLCSEFSSAYKIKTDFQSWGIDGLRLSSETQINLYRLLQEALSNVKRHSEANNVNIKLVSSHPNIILRVEDDGKGFNVDQRVEEAVNEKRMGLQGMHERARMLGGRMKIISRPGEGTKIIIEVPAAVNANLIEPDSNSNLKIINL